MKHALSSTPTLISRRQAAAMLSVNPKTIYRYECGGRLRAIKINSRTTRYRISDLENFIVDPEIGGLRESRVTNHPCNGDHP